MSKNAELDMRWLVVRKFWSPAARQERDAMRTLNFVGLGWVEQRAEEVARERCQESEGFTRYRVLKADWARARHEWSYDEGEQA